jgi:hypothetical protein
VQGDAAEVGHRSSVDFTAGIAALRATVSAGTAAMKKILEDIEIGVVDRETPK